MRRLGFSAAAVLAALALPAAALAQQGGGGGGKDKDPKAPIGQTPPEDRPKAEPWPRLDPGATLCASSSDLDQHFAVINARLDGAPPPPEPEGCRTVRVPVPVTVMQRESPGHTQVKLSRAPFTVGWTDMFLPDQAPVAARPTNARAPGL